jgi:peptidoglycan-associated lipoprotein
MSRRAIILGVAALLWAAPAFAQDRGTMEFGAFGSAASFDKALTLNSADGGGGRIGMYFDPRWSIEVEDGEMRATRTLGLTSVNVGILSTRLTATAVKSGPFSFLVGAGFGAGTETNFLHSYGLNGLIGAKWALSNTAAIRVDGIVDWLANYNYETYKSIHVGLVLYRHPNVKVVTNTVTVVGPPAPVAVVAPMVQRPDSVSAEEQARLRRRDEEYRRLRDSLSQPVASGEVLLPSSASALATMVAQIHFATDKSELSAEAKSILDAKVLVFRANPAMRIIIIGNTDERASDTYNMLLGGRRSAAAKAYLVAQGIDAVRIEVSSDGKRDPEAAGVSTTAEAMNRRDEFRLLIGSDYLKPPTQ